MFATETVETEVCVLCACVGGGGGCNHGPNATPSLAATPLV